MTVRKIGETSVHSPLKRVALLILAVVFFVSATAFAVPPVMYNVTIYDGSSVTEVLTSKNTADEILADEGIEINEEKADEVSLANFDGKDGSAIIIRRGVEVTIESFDGSKNTVYALGTVKDALKKAEIKLKKGTALNYSADTLLEDGMTIEIYDIYKITLTVDGKTLTKKVSGKTVEDALNVLGVELKGTQIEFDLGSLWWTRGDSFNHCVAAVETGGEQQSTGLLHLIIRISFPIMK